jgi:hypothetical protein
MRNIAEEIAKKRKAREMTLANLQTAAQAARAVTQGGTKLDASLKAAKTALKDVKD